ncbi:YqhA family protein [Microvirga sp. 2TAF3]|uniref:YqhA family protein n=1 Tax=Microvirga sp. 2TAF3 TaxID=3233014 RepID=UPI003F9A5E6B
MMEPGDTRLLDRFLFASRRLMAPFYVGLVISLALLLAAALQALFHFVTHALQATESDVMLGVLTPHRPALTGKRPLKLGRLNKDRADAMTRAGTMRLSNEEHRLDPKSAFHIWVRGSRAP